MRVAICVLRMLGVGLNPAEELIDIPPETAADFGGIVTFAMANWMNREPKDGPRADGRSSKLRPPRKLRPSSLTNSYLRGGRRQVPMSWGEVCDVELVGFSALLLALSMFMSAPARAEECQQKCEAEAAEHASAALQVYYINCLLNGGGMTDCMIQATVWAAQVYTQVHGECMDECQGEGEEEAQEQKRSAITKWNEEAEQADEAQVKYTGIPLRNLLIQDPGTADSSSETADGGSESSG